MDTPPEKRKNDGLYKVFAENFPIADTRNNFVLEFLDYYIDPPHYSIDELFGARAHIQRAFESKTEGCIVLILIMKISIRLFRMFYLGPIPYMTPKGTFVINGAERVVVSQLHRSPGVFFGQSVHANGTKLYSARIIPFKGSWIEFATDINNVMYAYIDRKKEIACYYSVKSCRF